MVKVLFSIAAVLFAIAYFMPASPSSGRFKDVVTETVIDGKRCGIYDYVDSEKKTSSRIGTYCFNR